MFITIHLLLMKNKYFVSKKRLLLISLINVLNKFENNTIILVINSF